MQANPNIVLSSYRHPQLALVKVCNIVLTVGNPLYSANSAKDFGDVKYAYKH